MLIDLFMMMLTKLMCFQVARTLVLKVQIKALYTCNGVHLGSHERMTQDRST